MADRVGATATALQPIEMLIKKLVLESYVLPADDTGLKVLDEKAPGGAVRGHLWYYVGEVYTPDWTKEGPGLFLAERNGGYLVADAYRGFDHVFVREPVDGEYPPPIECGCWAHARRGFVELADRGDPRAATMLHHVKKLYDVEREAKEARDGPTERLARRQREAIPVLETIRVWCAEMREREPLASAIGYVVNQWAALCRFAEDGALPIDNTLVERALRGVAMGRRNYLFAGSEAGAMRAATLYTTIASCKLSGVEPMAYLEDVLRKIQAEQWPYGRLRELVPDRWRETAPASALLPTKR